MTCFRRFIKKLKIWNQYFKKGLDYFGIIFNDQLKYSFGFFYLYDRVRFVNRAEILFAPSVQSKLREELYLLLNIYFFFFFSFIFIYFFLYTDINGNFTLCHEF